MEVYNILMGDTVNYIGKYHESSVAPFGSVEYRLRKARMTFRFVYKPKVARYVIVAEDLRK